MSFGKLLALNEHAAGAAAWVKNAALVRLDHFHEQFDDGLSGVELPALFALRSGKLAQEILIDAAQNVLGPAFLVAQANRADEVDEPAQAVLIERFAGVVLGQDALERRVLFLNGEHGFIQQLANGGLLGAGLELGPAGGFGHPKDVFGGVFVAVFGVRVRLFLQGLEPLLEGVGDVLEENEPEDDVLIVPRVHIAAQLVRHLPQLLLEAEIRSVLGALRFGFLF